MKKILLHIVCLLCCVAARAQTDSSVVASQKENKVSFKANLPALTQIPGAPKPFYTYLWDFGDGHFSTEENPEHVYTKEGDYDAVLYAVNNYDDGKKPGRKPKRISVSQLNSSYIASQSTSENNFFKANGAFELKYDCMAKPGDTMLLIAGWKNEQMAKGKLYFFFNEKQFEQNSFDTAGFRLYHDAALINDRQSIAAAQPFKNLWLTSSGSPASHFKEEKSFTGIESKTFLLNTLKNYNQVFTVESKAAADAQFMFANLHVTPGMIKDTNATVTITGVFVPDSGSAYMHQLNIPIVASHDPNKMNLRHGRLNYRTLKKNKSLGYKIRFQNDGEGPAKKIRLAITLPSAMDPQTIRIKDMSPYCAPCDSVATRTGCWELLTTKDSASFIFNGIYLPGTHQKNVNDKDSTKGFVEFDVKTKKKLDNLPFKGRTAIYFDKNEPVITNYATGKFRPAISPMIMAGYEMQLGQNNFNDGLTLGAAIARLAPYKPYFQFELFGKHVQNSSGQQAVQTPGTLNIEGKIYDYRGYTQQTNSTITRIGCVPLHLRYNFNNLVSAGVGMRVDANLSGTTDSSRVYLLSNFNGQGGYKYPLTLHNNVAMFSDSEWLPFIDAQIGKVRLGPQLGTRFYYSGTKRSYLYFYASWRL